MHLPKPRSASLGNFIVISPSAQIQRSWFGQISCCLLYSMTQDRFITANCSKQERQVWGDVWYKSYSVQTRYLQFRQSQLVATPCVNERFLSWFITILWIFGAWCFQIKFKTDISDKNVKQKSRQDLHDWEWGLEAIDDWEIDLQELIELPNHK